MVIQRLQIIAYIVTTLVGLLFRPSEEISKSATLKTLAMSSGVDTLVASGNVTYFNLCFYVNCLFFYLSLFIIYFSASST